jgi:hypothetical protein
MRDHDQVVYTVGKEMGKVKSSGPGWGVTEILPPPGGDESLEGKPMTERLAPTATHNFWPDLKSRIQSAQRHACWRFTGKLVLL